MESVGRIGMSLVIFIATALLIGLTIHDWSRLSKLKSSGSGQESAEGVKSIVDSAVVDTKSGVILEKKLKGVTGVFAVGTDEILVSPDVYQEYSEGDTVEYFSVSVTVPKVEKDVGSDTNISFVTAVDDCPKGVGTVEEQLTSKVKVQTEKNSEALLTHYDESFRTFWAYAVLMSAVSVAAILYLLVPLFRYGF